MKSITQAWIEQVLDESGAECPNCEVWRRLVDGYFIEKCPNCSDDETYLFDVGSPI